MPTPALGLTEAAAMSGHRDRRSIEVRGQPARHDHTLDESRARTTGSGSSSIWVFPAKFRLKVLEPVSFPVPPGQERYSTSRVMEAGETVRRRIQDALHDMLAARRSVWFG